MLIREIKPCIWKFMLMLRVFIVDTQSDHVCVFANGLTVGSSWVPLGDTNHIRRHVLWSRWWCGVWSRCRCNERAPCTGSCCHTDRLDSGTAGSTCQDSRMRGMQQTRHRSGHRTWTHRILKTQQKMITAGSVNLLKKTTSEKHSEMYAVLSYYTYF